MNNDNQRDNKKYNCNSIHKVNPLNIKNIVIENLRPKKYIDKNSANQISFQIEQFIKGNKRSNKSPIRLKHFDYEEEDDNNDDTLFDLQSKLNGLIEEYIQTKTTSKLIVIESQGLDVISKQLDKEINNQLNIKRTLIQGIHFLKKQIDYHYSNLFNDHFSQLFSNKISKKSPMPEISDVISLANKEGKNLSKLFRIIKQDINQQKHLLKSMSNPDLFIKKTTELDLIKEKKQRLKGVIAELNKIKDNHIKCESIINKLRYELLSYQNEYSNMILTKGKPKAQSYNRINKKYDLPYSLNRSNDSKSRIQCYMKLLNQSNKKSKITPHSYKSDPINELTLFKPEEKFVLEQVFSQEELNVFANRYNKIVISKQNLNIIRSQELQYYKHSKAIKECDINYMNKEIALLENEYAQLEIDYNMNRENISIIKQRIKEIMNCIDIKKRRLNNRLSNINH